MSRLNTFKGSLLKSRKLKTEHAAEASTFSAARQTRWMNMHMGLPGMLAAGIIAGYAVFYATVILPTQQQISSTKDKIRIVEEKRERGDLKKEFLQTPEGRLATFYQSLPADKNATDWIEKVFSNSEQASLNLDKGDYQTVRSKKGKLVRYQITLPVKATYPQIRSYIAMVMEDIPFMALEHVEYRREKIAEPEVEATIKLALYFVGEGS